MIEQVYDLIAARIITPNDRKNCYLTLSVIHDIWTPVPERFKDWIAIPRDNLYQSLHTSVIGDGGQPFEVQIRTEEMHHIAEEGVAAHWKYKESKLGKKEEDESLDELRKTVEKLLLPLVEDTREHDDSEDFIETSQTRSVSERCLCVHADGQGDPAAARLDADRFCLCDPLAGWRHLHRCKDQRPDRAVAKRAAKRRRRRDIDNAKFKTVRRLAQSYGHLQGSQPDPALDLAAAADESIDIGRKLLEKEAEKFRVSAQESFSITRAR